jgi:hypothetical protein
MGDVLKTRKPECLINYSVTWAYLGHLCMPQDEGRTSLHDFDFKASALYLVSMSTFWMLIVAAGNLKKHELYQHKHVLNLSG